MIIIDKGESKALTFTVDGDVSADHTRIYIVNSSNASVAKFSTDIITDSTFKAFQSVTYNSTDNKTLFVGHLEISETTALAEGHYDSAIWSKSVVTGFAEGYADISRVKSNVSVRSVLPTS